MTAGAPRICVAGVGALGGLLAAMLARTQPHLSVVARGETLRRIRTDGLVLHDGTQTHVVRPPADIRAPDAVQDIIILAAKAHQLPALAETVAHAVDSRTIIVPVVNGVPWWLTAGDGNPLGVARSVVDPHDVLARTFPAPGVVGCVAYAFASSDAPGVVRSLRPPLLLLGDPSCEPAYPPRVRIVEEIFRAAGIGIRLCPEIAREVWSKLAANLATNPLSVVCEADLTTLAASETMRALMGDVLRETIAVGEAYGIAPLKTVEELLGVIIGAGGHTTSMLQDYRGGRSLELPAIGHAVMALAAARGVPTPNAAAMVRIADFKSTRRT